jgi:hypothetical protein
MEISDNTKIILCVGLPGSNQLKLCETFTDFALHTNFVDSFYSDTIRNDLKNNKRICLVDPRLCKMDVFKRYYQYFKEDYSDKEILVILFEKNSEKAQENMLQNKQVDNNFDLYNKIYELSNYEEYNYVVFPVD